MFKILTGIALILAACLFGVIYGAKNTTHQTSTLKKETIAPANMDSTSEAPTKKVLENKLDADFNAKDNSLNILKANYLNKKRKGFTVLISSFSEELNAAQYAHKISKKGYDTFYFPKVIENKTWYRVGIGSFTIKENASGLKKELSKRNIGVDSVVAKIP